MGETEFLLLSVPVRSLIVFDAAALISWRLEAGVRLWPVFCIILIPHANFAEHLHQARCRKWPLRVGLRSGQRDQDIVRLTAELW